MEQHGNSQCSRRKLALFQVGRIGHSHHGLLDMRSQSPSTPQQHDEHSEDERTPRERSSFEHDCSAAPPHTSSKPSPKLPWRLTSLLASPACSQSSSPICSIAIVTYLLIFGLLFASPSLAAPQRHSLHVHVVQRQAIPDSSGGTGNMPASVVTSQQAPQETSFSSIITPTQSPNSTESRTSILSEISVPPTATITTFTPIATRSSPNTTTLMTPTPIATNNPRLQNTAPSKNISTATLMGIIMGSAVFLALLVGTAIFLYGRKEAQAVAEMPVRRSGIKERFQSRIFSPQQVEEVEETSDKTFQCIGDAERTSMSPRVWIRKELDKKNALEQDVVVPQQRYSPPNPLYSPSIYTPELRRFSTMASVNENRWLQSMSIGRPQPAFVDTTSQMLDVPSPLFSRAQHKMGGGTRLLAGPVRPSRNATPLGSLIGIGYGMGAGNNHVGVDKRYH